MFQHQKLDLEINLSKANGNRITHTTLLENVYWIYPTAQKAAGMADSFCHLTFLEMQILSSLIFLEQWCSLADQDSIMFSGR